MGDELERAAEVADAWAREIPGVPTRSVRVVWALKAVGGRLRRAREQALHDLGMDAATLDLLSTLRRSGPPYTLTTTQLAQRCLVSAGAISQRLARAERDSLVERRGLPGRRVAVTLTPTGHALVERGARHVLEVDDASARGLDDDELALLESLLERWLASGQRDAAGR